MNFKDVKKIVIPESAPQETEVVVANTSKSFSSSSTQSSFTYLNYYPTSDSNLGSNSKLRIKGTITSVSGTEYDEGSLYYRNSSGNLTSIGFSAGQTKSFDVVCYLTSEVSSTVWEVFKVEQYNMFATIGNQMRVQLNKTNNNNLDIYVYNTYAQALFTLTITEVSEYQTVENPVVKITDSNGNIIWGSPGAFPYRRLEYIHFNGAEYLWSQIGTKAGFFRQLIFDLERNNVRQCTIATYDGQSSSNNRRFYIADFHTTNGVRFCIGDSWTTGVALSNVPTNTKLMITARSYKSGSNNALQYSLQKEINGSWTNIISTSTLTGTSGTITDIQPYIGGCRTRKTDGTDVLENPMKGKIYYYEERNSNSSGNFVHRRYPAQRKSDGKCGLYDVTTGQFEVMYGTDIYQTAAGPTVDEYWDLTAPS